jgi:hypothetical protein
VSGADDQAAASASISPEYAKLLDDLREARLALGHASIALDLIDPREPQPGALADLVGDVQTQAEMIGRRSLAPGPGWPSPAAEDMAADHEAASGDLPDSKLSATPETYPGGIGDPANIGIRAGREAPDDLPDEALPAVADWLRDTAAEIEALEAAKARAADLADVGYGLDPDLSYGDAVRLRDDVNSRQQQPEAGA